MNNQEYEAEKTEQAKETASVLHNMGLSIDQIAQAVKSSPETVRQWLEECADK